MNAIRDILPKLLSKAQEEFLITLTSTIMVVFGKVNFTNMSRYSEINKRKYRRQFLRLYNFIKSNAKVIEKAITKTARQIIAIDCSFVPKSGKATYGIEYFYNGSGGRAEKGLEISVLSIVDVDEKQGYTLSVQQTPPAKPENKKTRIGRYLEHLQATHPYLPQSAHYVVTDSFYSKVKWADGWGDWQTAL